MSTPDSFYAWGAKEPLAAANFTRRFLDLSNRIKPLETLDLSYQALVGEVNDTVLAQVSASIAALMGQLQRLAQLQWLTGSSNTPINLVEGADAALLIDPSERDLFIPGPFSVLQRASDPDTYAVLRSQSYDRPSGQYNFEIVAAQGGPGPFSDWVVGAIAGATLAQFVFTDESKSARDTTVASAAQVATDRQAVEAINDRFTVSSLAPSGGQDGDIWFMI